MFIQGQVGRSSGANVVIAMAFSGSFAQEKKMLRRAKGGGLGQTSAGWVETLLSALALHRTPLFMIGFNTEQDNTILDHNGRLCALVLPARR